MSRAKRPSHRRATPSTVQAAPGQPPLTSDEQAILAADNEATQARVYRDIVKGLIAETQTLAMFHLDSDVREESEDLLEGLRSDLEASKEELRHAQSELVGAIEHLRAMADPRRRIEVV